jgi:hypothetical protein
MKFNFLVKKIINEAGGYIAQRSASRSPEEAIKNLKENLKQLEQNAKLLKIHSDRFEVDSDSYRRAVEVINTIQQWGNQIKDNQGRTLDQNKEIKNIFDITNRPEHDYTTIKPETKLTSWKPLYRKWFSLYSRFPELLPQKQFSAVNKRSVDTQQAPDANEIFYYGTDGLPYVTRMSFDAQGNIDGVIFLRTNRFQDIQVDQIRDATGKPVRPIRFEKGKKKGTIPLNARVEKVFGQNEISKSELEDILQSKKAEKAFKQRIAKDPKLKAWYDKKYSKIATPK